MALSRTLYLTFAVSAVLFYVFYLKALLPPPQSASDDEEIIDDMEAGGVRRKMMVLGSRPPRCVNKCMSCRPCEATLVIPPHHGRNYRLVKGPDYNYVKYYSYAQKQDVSYYLLSWKCRCGNKYYQP